MDITLALAIAGFVALVTAFVINARRDTRDFHQIKKCLEGLRYNIDTTREVANTAGNRILLTKASIEKLQKEVNHLKENRTVTVNIIETKAPKAKK